MKKTGFAARLEAMQKQQEQMMKRKAEQEINFCLRHFFQRGAGQYTLPGFLFSLFQVYQKINLLNMQTKYTYKEIWLIAYPILNQPAYGADDWHDRYRFPGTRREK